MLLLGLLTAGCAPAVQTRALLDAPPVELPRSAELVDTPLYPQEEYQCGPAALATVLVPLGHEVTPEALVDEVYLPARQGSLQPEMLAAIRKRGLLAVEIPDTINALLTEVSEGRPVLVLQNLGLAWYPRWHYAVVVGYDLEQELLVLRSGTTERWITPLAVFERTWARGRYWAIVAAEPGDVPKSAEPFAMLKATSALEEVGQPDNALKSYEAIAARWPYDALAQFSLANALMQKAEPSRAERHYRAAIAAQPGFAPAWNNLAYALRANGCREAALDAARCAARLAPDDASIRDTLEDIRTNPPSKVKNNCASLACPLAID